jgi:hypothetical protein
LAEGLLHEKLAAGLLFFIGARIKMHVRNSAGCRFHWAAIPPNHARPLILIAGIRQQADRNSLPGTESCDRKIFPQRFSSPGRLIEAPQFLAIPLRLQPVTQLVENEQHVVLAQSHGLLYDLWRPDFVLHLYERGGGQVLQRALAGQRYARPFPRPGVRFPVLYAIHDTAVFVLKNARKLSGTIVPSQWLPVEKQGDAVSGGGIAGYLQPQRGRIVSPRSGP